MAPSWISRVKIQETLKKKNHSLMLLLSISTARLFAILASYSEYHGVYNIE